MKNEPIVCSPGITYLQARNVGKSVPLRITNLNMGFPIVPPILVANHFGKGHYDYALHLQRLNGEVGNYDSFQPRPSPIGDEAINSILKERSMGLGDIHGTTAEPPKQDYSWMKQFINQSVGKPRAAKAIIDYLRLIGSFNTKTTGSMKPIDPFMPDSLCLMVQLATTYGRLPKIRPIHAGHRDTFYALVRLIASNENG